MSLRHLKPSHATFEEWVSQASIYIGYARYGQLGGHGFVVATAYDNCEDLRQAVEDLDAGDHEALRAGERIMAMDCLYASSPDPAIAMQLLMGKLRECQRAIDDEQRPSREER